MNLRLAACALSVVAAGALASPAGAATITPDIADDELDNSGGAGDTGCSLREAVAIANADSTTPEPNCTVNVSSGPLGDDTIQLDSFNYQLDLSGSPEDANVTGDLDVNTGAGSLTILGLGGLNTTISETVADRVMQQVTGSADALLLQDLTITGGQAADTFPGGGVASADGILDLQGVRVVTNSTNGPGGGVGAFGDGFSALDSTILNNTSTASSGGGGLALGTSGFSQITSSVISVNDSTTANGSPMGAGISFTNTTATVTGSLILGNDVTVTTGQALGGGINAFDTDLTVRDTTITGNSVVGGTIHEGGGLRMSTFDSPTSLTMINSTVTDNHADGSGGFAGGVKTAGDSAVFIHTTIGANSSGGVSGIQGNATTNTLRGSVIDAGSSSSCAGTFASGGGNVAEDSSCSLSGPSDVQGVDPVLDDLDDNDAAIAGAPGFTQPILIQLPLALSPVIDRVAVSSCNDDPSGHLLTDQRGLSRPDDADGDGVAACESGAVELQVSADGDFDGVPNSSDDCPTEVGPASNGGCPVSSTPPPGGGGQPITQQPTTGAKKKCKKKKKAKRAVAAKKKCKKRKHKK